MTTCEYYQALMLDYLYDLLDPTERFGVQGHLEGCKACRDALAQAESQQRLLAAAAKREFANVRFAAPAGTPIVPLKVPAQQPPRRRWLALAAAAAILLIVGGLAVPGGYYWMESARLEQEFDVAKSRYDEAGARLNRHNEPVFKARRNVDELEARLRANQDGLQNKQSELAAQILGKHVVLDVTGPQPIEPGGVNEFFIAARDLNDQPVAATVLGRVIDQRTKKVVRDQIHAAKGDAEGEYILSLPRDLEFKPGTELALEVAAKTATGDESRLNEPLQLAAPVYITHLTTDKPMYQPGETVSFRSLTIDRFSLKPPELKPEEELRLNYRITSPSGEQVMDLTGLAVVLDPKTRKPLLGPDNKPIRGVGSGEFAIKPDAPGGEYSLTVSEFFNRFPSATRKFIVNRYEKPRLKKELEFTRKTYGPGDEVVAACKASPAEGGNAVANQPVNATIRIDGETYDASGNPSEAPLSLRTDSNGAVAVRFTLPAEIERGEASLAVQFTDGGSVETIVRPIPIVLKKLNVELFAEGGDLIAGVPNRVYFWARTTLGKPAELTADLLDDSGAAVEHLGQKVVLQTLNDAEQPGANQGMGVFTFIPEAGKKYTVKTERPAGVRAEFQFPEVKSEGLVLHVPQTVLSDKDTITVTLHSRHNAPKETRTLVGAYCRGRLLAHKIVTVKDGAPTSVELKPEGGVGGVYRVTVFEEEKDSRQWRPVAERLIYRKPAERVNVAIRPQRPKFMPGERVMLNCETTDESGKARAALLLLAVVDKNLLTLADEKTARSMTTHFFLTTEVSKPDDLEHADFFLGDHPKAAVALDLLLGTQGWRRFAEQDWEGFRERHKEDAERYLALMGQTLVPTNNHDALAIACQGQLTQELNKAQQAFAQEEARINASLAKAREQLAIEEKQLQEKEATLKLSSELSERSRQFRDSHRQLQAFTQEWRIHGLLVLGIILVTVGVISLVAGYIRGGQSARLCFAVTGCSVVLLMSGLMWVGLGMPGVHTMAELPPESAFRTNNSPAQIDVLQTGVGDVASSAGGPAVASVDFNFRAGAVRLPPPPPGAEGQPPAEVATAPAANADLPQPGGGADGNFDRATGKVNPAGAPRALNENRAKEAELRGIAKGGAEKRFKNLAGEALVAQTPELSKADAKRARAPGRATGPGEQGEPGMGFGEGKKKLAGAGAEERWFMDRKELPAARSLFVVPPGQDARVLDARKAVDEARALTRRNATPTTPQPGTGALGDGINKERLGLPQGGGAAYVPFAKPMAPGGQPGAAGGMGGGPGMPRGGGFGLGGVGLMDDQVHSPPPPPPPPLVVREYAHQRSLGQRNVRTDFTETLYWHPVIVLPTGNAKVEFDLCDSITTFQVTAYAHTLDGRLGAVQSLFESKLPFSVEPKIPVEVTASDRIDIPVTIANDTDDKRSVSMGIAVNGMAVEGKADREVVLPPNSRGRETFRLQPKLVEGLAELSLMGRSDPFASDAIVRTIKVVPDGFPIVGARSDLLEKTATNEIVMPESWIKGTLKCKVQVYPSTLADLQKGLEGLLREPGGCFEQTSTSNYPNLLILDYLKEADLANPEVAARARNMLDNGYKRLTSFECLNPSRNHREGYEWFGGTAPAHEALTAYGLMQFRDMARVFPVDQTMVERTRQYLMSRRDGKGGFLRNPRALDTFGRASEAVTNAYIVWALTDSSQEDDIGKELDALKGQAKASKDPYFIALVANSLVNRSQMEDAVVLLKKLAEEQKPDGHLEGGTTSITGSRGRDLQIETTALTLLAWLKANRPEFQANVQLATKWLGQQRGGSGGFGATQSTILALKALIAHTRANKKTAEAGDLVLYVDDKEAGRLSFPAGVQDALVVELKDADQVLKPGKNKLRVEITGKNTFPYTLTWSYQTVKPAAGEGCPVSLATQLDRTTAQEGETVRLSVTVANASGQGQGMAVAIIGLPAGLTLPEDFKQLKDYTRLEDNGTKPGKISAWETRGRELILYWRDLAPDARIEVPIDLICRVPGEYSGPASRAYLYYNADTKAWVDPLKIQIRAK